MYLLINKNIFPKSNYVQNILKSLLDAVSYHWPISDRTHTHTLSLTHTNMHSLINIVGMIFLLKDKTANICT